MIENAPAIFGKDVISVFSSNDEARKQYLKRTSQEMKQQEYKDLQQQDQKQIEQPNQIEPKHEQMLLNQEEQKHQQQDRLSDDVIINVNSRLECQDLKENLKPNCNINLSRTEIIRDDGLTSILIVNPTKRQQEQQQQLYLQCLQQQQHYIQCQQRQQQLYLQCQQQQQDRYLLYQYQPFIKPQQSRVMSLRDYYLSKNQTIVTLV